MHIFLNTFRDALCCKTNHDNSPPLHYFVQSNPTSTDKLFFLTQMIYQYLESLWITNGLSEAPLTITCQYCNENVIQLFLIYSPEAVNDRDNNSNLPIHHILKQKLLVSSNVIQQLVNIAPMMCVKPTCQNKPNYPTKLPLYYALHDHPDSTIRVLVECYPWSLVIPPNPKGRLPLHLACIHGKSSIIPLLLGQNPHAVRQRDNWNRLPIHYALNNLPDITTETLQQIVNKWQDLCYEFCIEHDLTDSDNSWYYLDKDEVHNMFDDWQFTLRAETNYQHYVLHF